MAETSKTLIQDLADVQSEIAKINIKKDAKGNFGKYVTLDAIHEAVLPITSAHGFAWVTLPTYDENGESILEYKLLHVSGEKIEGKMRIYIDKTTAQGQGSAITYAKRYSICAVLGITADDDDDGTAASKVPAAPYKKKEEPKPARVEPSEPSRQVTDEPISNLSKEKVRRALVSKGLHGDKVTEFCQFIINKPAPTTERDAVELLKSLEAE